MKWLDSLLGDETGQKPRFAIASSERPAHAEDGAAGPPPLPPISDELSAAGTTASDDANTRGADNGGPAEEPAPVVEAEPAAPPLFVELAAAQKDLAKQQRELNDLFSTRLRSDEAQARAVEKLHDELRQYKSNFVRQQILPVLKEVIFCHDFATNELIRLTPAAPTGGEEASSATAGSLAVSRVDAAPAVKALEIARQMLQDLLFKYDVEPYRNDEAAFDPKSQQCMQTTPTDRSELDKKVATRGLEGFRGPDGILRREQVTVYKFHPGVS